MTTTAIATTTSTPFPPGLMDEFFAELPFTVRIKMILDWARQFAINGEKHLADRILVELIESITILDFSYYVGINKKPMGDDSHPFVNLVHLPFSPSLAHLNLSNTPIGKSDECMEVLSHPIFQHLVTLDLSDTKIKNIDPLFNAPHIFPNLHTINLSRNNHLFIPQIATTTQFPNLKVLNLVSTNIDGTLAGFSIFNPPLTPSLSSTTTSAAETTPTAAATTHPSSHIPPLRNPPFQLEKLILTAPNGRTILYDFDPNSLISLSRSPHLAQLKELYISSDVMSSDTIRQVFDPEHSMLKDLTGLYVTSCLNPFQLQALGESPLLSNLTSLELYCDATLPKNLSNVQIKLRNEAFQQFLQSPFLWTSKLKHLKIWSGLGQLEHLTTRVNHWSCFTFHDIIRTLNTANIKLETLKLTSTSSDWESVLTEPCFSNLKELKIESNELKPLNHFTPDQFLKLHFLPNIERFPFRLNQFDQHDLVRILSSPKMSNNLIEFNLWGYKYPVSEVIKTLCTQRVIPGDETSPLKYGKLKKLHLGFTGVTDADVELIVANLTQLTHLNLSQEPDRFLVRTITDKTITTLLATEHGNPDHPYTSLPNLVHLDLMGTGITCNGLVQLSKSQLLDQLETLHLDQTSVLPWRDVRQPAPPGLHALLTTPRVSNLKRLFLHDLSPPRGRLEQSCDDRILKYLGNCLIWSF